MSFSDCRYDSQSACAPIFEIRPTTWAAQCIGAYHSKYRGTVTYTDCHINVPKKGWRHKCCSKKSAPQSERFFDNHYNG